MKSESEIVDIAKNCAIRLDEKKSEDIQLLNLQAVNSYLDYFLIATGNSIIHCSAIAKDIDAFLSQSGLKGRNKPNYNSGWIIIDYSELIVHVFTHEMRNYYQLERLWGDADSIDF